MSLQQEELLTFSSPSDPCEEMWQKQCSQHVQCSQQPALHWRKDHFSALTVWPSMGQIGLDV